MLTRFERAGFKIVGVKMLAPNYEQLHKHYEGIGTQDAPRRANFENQLRNMQVGPVIAMILQGVDAVETVRKMVGATEPKSALPGTIRGDYAHVSYTRADGSGVAISNIIHASADEKEAPEEIDHWFAGQGNLCRLPDGARDVYAAAQEAE